MSVLAVPARRSVLVDLLPGARVRDVVLVACGAGLTGLAAQVVVPLPGTPVPVTGQTFGVLLTGAALGWHRGAASMLLYLLAGLAGVPWFAEGSAGWPAATGGYLVGFVLAAAVVGALAGRGGDRTPLRTVAVMVAGNVAIYAVGVPVLMGATGLGLVAALGAGVVPFLLGDALKVAFAAGLLPGTWAVVRRFGHS